jgi:hypothetical protein
LKDLEEYLAGKDHKGPTPEQAAAGGASGMTLISIWMLEKYLSGGRKEDIEEAVRVWKDSRTAGIPEKEPSTMLEQVASRPERRPIEKAEERLRRQVDTADEYVRALEKSRQEFNQVVDKVPEHLKESEFWKNRVQPQLDKVSEYTNPDKVRKGIDELRRLLDMRQEWESGAGRHMDPEKRDLVIGFDRMVSSGAKGVAKVHEKYITDPFKSYADNAPKGLADPIKKFADRHQKDMDGLFEGGARAIRKGLETVASGGKSRFDAMNEALRAGDHETYGEFKEQEIPLDPRHKPDFSRSIEKVKPIYEKAAGYYERFRQWLSDSGIVFFYRVKPIEPDE